MKKFFSNKIVKKLLYGVLVFILAGCIVSGSMTALVRFTAFEGGFLNDALNNSNYYTDLCNEITDDLMDIGDASGLDKSFFEGFINEVFVREDVQDYVNKFYAGEKLTVDTRHFDESLRKAIESYIQTKRIKSGDYSKSNINYFVKEATKIYSRNIELKYFDILQKLVSEYSFKLTVILIISAVVAAVICAVMFFTNEWKHKAVRYISYSVGGSALFILLIPLITFASGVIGRITIISRSLSDMYTTCLNSIMIDMLVVAGVLFVIYAALIIIHNKIRSKAT